MLSKILFNDIPIALHLFEVAAKSCIIQAMNAIGIFSQTASLNLFDSPIFTFDESLKWFNRALTAGSDDVLISVVELYKRKNNQIDAF